RREEEAKVAEERRVKARESYVRDIGLAWQEWSAGRADRAEELLDACLPEMRDWEWRYLKGRCHGELWRAGGSSDRSALAVGDGGTILARAVNGTNSTLFRIVLADVRTGRALHTFEGHTKTIRALAFHPTGAILASGGDDKVIRIWNVLGRRLLRTLPERPGPISALAFLPDGKHLV